MSYAATLRDPSKLWFGMSGTPPCEVDLDCPDGTVCCGMPDGTSSCIPWDECKKKVSEQCAADPHKSSARCALWNQDGDWYAEGEGPCTYDADCWPTLACCGERSGKRYCIPRSECQAKAAAAESKNIPTWVYAAGGGALVLLLVAVVSRVRPEE